MISLAQREEAAPAEAPAMTALLVYLRPLARQQLLPVLAELGVFVHEVAPEQLPIILKGGVVSSDLVIVAGEADSEHLRLVRDLTRQVSTAVLAIAPDENAAPALEQAGALATVGERELPYALGEKLLFVARIARRLRSGKQAATERTVFGRLRFQDDPARLVAGDRAVSLTPIERAILVALCGVPGVAVEGTTLEQLALRHRGELAPPALRHSRTRAAILGLRRKAEALGGDPMLLGAVRGYGYVLRG
jgi:hypothetical protein